MMDMDTLPNQNLAGGLQRYIEHGIEPGSFLEAVLCNDLKRSFAKADDINQRLLFDIVKWLWNEFPANAWGSEDAYRSWIEMGGVKGRMQQRSAEEGGS